MMGSYKVGLTGGIGSGKTTVANIFSALGVKVIDADTISRELTRKGEPLLNILVSAFGDDILDKNGELKRDTLKEIIFNNENAKIRLENLIHPKVFEKIEKDVREMDTEYCVISIPLLFETGSENLFDSVLVVDCPEELQIKRILQRDGITPELAKNIIENQMSRDKRLKKSNDVITNNTSLDNLESQVYELHKEYRKRSKLQTEQL
jgi:dephospho-CoA kinase